MQKVSPSVLLKGFYISVFLEQWEALDVESFFQPRFGVAGMKYRLVSLVVCFCCISRTNWANYWSPVNKGERRSFQILRASVSKSHLSLKVPIKCSHQHKQKRERNYLIWIVAGYMQIPLNLLSTSVHYKVPSSSLIVSTNWKVFSIILSVMCHHLQQRKALKHWVNVSSWEVFRIDA